MKKPKPPICTGCTLLCDDVDFVVDQTGITSDIDCPVAQSFLKSANQFLFTASKISASKISAPKISAPKTSASKTVPKTSSDFETLSKTLSDRLQSAGAPLIVGLNHLTTEAQQLAWRIADVTGATIDTTLSKANRSSIYALQRLGKVTASLGEIANRSDLVVFWFCDPMTTHPRLIERLTQTKNAVKKRIVVVGDSNSATAKVANDVCAVTGADAADLIRDVRRAIGQKEGATDSTSEAAKKLARLLTGSNYGSWIYGHTDVAAEQDDVTGASQTLVRELNDHTRFVSLGLRSDQNAASGENVMAALSGFPVAVDLSLSIPQYNGPEHAAETVLENGECDFVLLFAGWGTSGEIDKLSPAAKACLAKIPKALISSDPSLGLGAELLVPIDRPGVSDSGEFCRVDDVSMAARGMVSGNLGSATEFLRLVFQRLSNH